MADNWETLLENWSERLLSGAFPAWAELPELELYMDQVMVLMDRYLGGMGQEEGRTVTPAILNNYVKQGLIKPPVKKKYGRDQLAQLLMVCSLKRILPLSAIDRFLKSQLGRRTVEELYESFRISYDRATADAADQVEKQSREYRDEFGQDNFLLYMALKAEAEKSLAEQLIGKEEAGLVEERHRKRAH